MSDPDPEARRGPPSGAGSPASPYFDVSHWRKVLVTGSDGASWLDDLVSADLSDLRPGSARRTLLLTPTGRIRALFTVAATAEGLLLLQDPGQPRGVDALLAPYVLSSDVEVRDRTAELALFALPGTADAPAVGPALVSTPSCLGPGVDLLVPADAAPAVRASLGASLRTGTEADLEAWLVASALPRFGIDAAEDDLPQEAALEDWVSFSKGCYLGQEAVAKVRNLGHPRRLLLALAADGDARPGDAVEVGGREAGVVTSAATVDGTVLVLAKVRWDAREGPFSTSAGVPLLRRPQGARHGP